MSDVYDEMFAVMITGQDDSGEWDIAELRKGFNFGVHGDDKDGNWDIEFPTMFAAIEFHRCWSGSIAEFEIRRNDTVTHLDNPVVMIMTPKNKF